MITVHHSATQVLEMPFWSVWFYSRAASKTCRYSSVRWQHRNEEACYGMRGRQVLSLTWEGVVGLPPRSATAPSASDRAHDSAICGQRLSHQQSLVTAVYLIIGAQYGYLSRLYTLELLQWTVQSD
eukprot:6181264-Pleurochrysis_carterae.AAC.3